jgi:hypothetical protein
LGVPHLPQKTWGGSVTAAETTRLALSVEEDARLTITH